MCSWIRIIKTLELPQPSIESMQSLSISQRDFFFTEAEKSCKIFIGSLIKTFKAKKTLTMAKTRMFKDKEVS